MPLEMNLRTVKSCSDLQVVHFAGFCSRCKISPSKFEHAQKQHLEMGSRVQKCLRILDFYLLLSGLLPLSFASLAPLFSFVGHLLVKTSFRWKKVLGKAFRWKKVHAGKWKRF